MRLSQIVPLLVAVSCFSCKNDKMEQLLAKTKLELTETEKAIAANNIALEKNNKRILLYEEVSHNLLYASNDDYVVRVDQTTEDSLRFTCWKLPKDITQLPDHIAYGGVLKKTGEWGVYEYTFVLDNQTFMVETVPVKRGSKRNHIFLELKQRNYPKYYSKMKDLRTPVKY